MDYTVPFGAFAGLGARGFVSSALDFGLAPQATLDQLQASGRTSFSPFQQKTTPLETFTVGGVGCDIRIAALDTSDDNAAKYDTLVFFDQTRGIPPWPILAARDGTGLRGGGCRALQSLLPERKQQPGGHRVLCRASRAGSIERPIARYAANFIPHNPPVLENVDDINNHVGFWAPQPDFRIPERLSPGFVDFPDLELEAIYQDQVRSFVDYQTRLALRAIQQNPDADLVMIYIEQPDGSGHQFLITDPRQATNPLDASSIGPNQDRAKIRRYREYLRHAYQVADDAVQRIIEALGQEPNGRPRSNVIVVSDHGFAPFHTAVKINNLLASHGLDPTKIRAITSGPAVNVYINLQGREPDGIALLGIGYNFDGTQSPVVRRLGDPSVPAPVFSVPNFYGAHGYDPKHRNMSAIFIACGSDVRVGELDQARNIDVAPTVFKLLGVDGSEKIEGKVLPVLR